MHFCMYFRAKKPLNCIFESTLFLSSLFFGFSLKFLDLIMKKTVVFIYISSNRIQHKFFIYFFCCPVIETAKTIIFFDIPKMSFCLNGTDLPVQNSFLTLDVCMGFFFQSFPLFVDLHDFIFLCIFFQHHIYRDILLYVRSRCNRNIHTPQRFVCNQPVLFSQS